MRMTISRWFMFGLLLGWSLTHANVFGQPATNSGGTPGKAGKAATTTGKIRQGLDKVITVDYTGQSLQDVVNHLRDRMGVSITLDQMAILNMGMNPDDNVGQIQVKATDEKASQVLRRFLNNYRLCYIVMEDSLLVTTEEFAVFRQMRQRVSVDVENVPLHKAVRDIAKSTGINLVIDPNVIKKADNPVTLQLENTGVETAVRLLAELGSLKAVRMGNVMFITHEEKAKKIRDEEGNQFDNPLNPNIPIMPGIPRAFGFGNIGGAMPPQVQPGVPGIPIAPDAPPPPPGVELPPAKDAPLPAPAKDQPAPKRVIEIRPDGTLPPIPAQPQPPAVERRNTPPATLPAPPSDPR